MISATVDELAQIIRRVDGNHSLGAGALAEAILANIPQRAVSDDLSQLEAKALAATQPAGIRGTEEPYLASEFRLIATPSVVLELIERIRAAEAKAGEPVVIKPLEWRAAGTNKYGGESWEACGCNKWYKIFDVGKDSGNGLQFYLEYVGQYETIEEAKSVAQQKHEQSLHPCLYGAPVDTAAFAAMIAAQEG